MSTCARKSYKSVVSGVTNLREKHVLAEVARKIRSEMTEICSFKYASLLRKKNEELEHFSWDELYLELVTKVPMLVKFLQAILPGADKIFVAFIVCMLLKRRCKHMSLMQRMMSVLLYGHAANKQVCFVYVADEVSICNVCCEDLQVSSALHDLHVTISHFQDH